MPGATTGSPSKGESTEYDTNVAVCHEAGCAAACGERLDECYEPLAGICSAEGLCECAQAQACPPCVQEDCEPWEECTSEFGVCGIPCSGSVAVELDPAGGCQISVEHLPSTILRDLLIDNVRARRVDDCADAGADAAWTWLEQDVTMLICAETCAQLSEASELAVAWAWPCE
jgi:hypothetical protein